MVFNEVEGIYGCVPKGILDMGSGLAMLERRLRGTVKSRFRSGPKFELQAYVGWRGTQFRSGGQEDAVQPACTST